MSRGHRLRAARNLVVGLALVASIGAGVAQAQPSGASTNQAAVPSKSQASPDEGYVYRLYDAAMKAPNFGSAIVHQHPRGITIFGVGYPTAAVQKLLDHAPAGIIAKWRRCPYTHRDLERETMRLLHTSGHRLNLIGPNNYASGLIVGTLDKALLSSYHPAQLLGSTYAVRVIRRGPGHGDQASPHLPTTTGG